MQRLQVEGSDDDIETHDDSTDDFGDFGVMFARGTSTNIGACKPYIVHKAIASPASLVCSSRVGVSHEGEKG